MRKLSLAAAMMACALMLAGCNTSFLGKPEASTGAATTPATPSTSDLDAKVAKVSVALAKECWFAETAISGAQLVVHKTPVLTVLRSAEAGIATYCSGKPPASVDEAIDRLADIVVSVHQALAAS